MLKYIYIWSDELFDQKREKLVETQNFFIIILMSIIPVRVHTVISRFDEYLESKDFTAFLDIFLMEHYM